MEPEDLEQFLRDMVSENAPVDGDTEKNGDDLARLLGTYYRKFMLYGFSEERAFQMTVFVLERILKRAEETNGGQKT